MKKSKRAILSAVVTASTAVAGAATAQTTTIKDVSYLPATSAAKLKAVKVAGQDAIEVSGPGTPVKLDCAPAAAKAGANKALGAFSVGIRHVDKGDHGFEIALVEAKPTTATAKASITCNGFKPAAKASILCDAMKPAATATLLDTDKPASAKGGSATIRPSFAGSETFSATVFKNGKKVKSLTGLKGAVAIPDFDTVHVGKEETLGVSFVYGSERKGAWTIKVEHEEFTVLLTADAEQKPLVGGGQVTLSTTGLDTVTLVDQKLQLADAGPTVK